MITFYVYCLVLTFFFNLTYPRSHFRSVPITVNDSYHLLNACYTQWIVLSTLHMLPLAIFILILGGTIIIPVLELRKQKYKGVTWASQDPTGIRAELGLELMQTRLLPTAALTCQLPRPPAQASSQRQELRLWIWSTVQPCSLSKCDQWLLWPFMSVKNLCPGIYANLSWVLAWRCGVG